MISCPYFWYGVVAGIIAVLITGAIGLFVLFRAFNDNSWEGAGSKRRQETEGGDEP